MESLWETQEGREATVPALKLPALIETITRMTGTSEDLLIGRRPNTISRPRTTSTPAPLPKSHSHVPTDLSAQVPTPPAFPTSIRKELATPRAFGAMFTSLRTETTTRRLMSRRNVRFAYAKTERQEEMRQIRLKGRQFRGTSVPTHPQSTTNQGQQVTIDNRPDLDLSISTSKAGSGSSSRLKPRFEESKKRTPLNFVLM